MENKNERKKKTYPKTPFLLYARTRIPTKQKKNEKRDNELAIAAAAVYDGRIYKMFG